MCGHLGMCVYQLAVGEKTGESIDSVEKNIGTVSEYSLSICIEKCMHLTRLKEVVKAVGLCGIGGRLNYKVLWEILPGDRFCQHDAGTKICMFEYVI